MSPRTDVPALQGVPAAGIFQGRRMVVASDADMVPSAYINGQLGPREAGQEDTLTVIELPLAFDGTSPTIGTAPAPNSVTGPPAVLAVDADGTRAYVIETLGQRGPEAQTLSDLAPGNTIRAYDLTNGSSPRLLFTGTAGHMPQAVSLHPDGQLLALAGGDVFSLASPQAEPSLRLLRVEADRFGDEVMLEPLSDDGEPIVASYVEWHPGGDLVAVCFPWRDEVRLFGAHRSPALRLEPLGPPIKTGKFPFAGRFTPDGRHFITTDVQWGHDVEGVYGEPADGHLSVLRIDPRTGTGEKIGDARVGRSPEGIAVSPDGRYIVTSNLRMSFRPWDDPRLDRQSSLSLLTFDPANGRLETVAEELFDGLLPEGPAFDADGKFVVVTVFDHLDLAHRRGGLRFFEVIHDNAQPQLRPTLFSLEVMRGAHTLVVV
ncbi:lactonase family protein [Micromonospora phytophila]|uniref:beta-propeller fold lactonase family protein n=1 Tax=Micromonospora phytophila TaxID=709888 RepID=UPI002030334B|nr:beta-propeller fold lactonase family protein [Micromonospora phytophila]MCM0675296.1 lactonase family protein [Micromonospora phytophila]